MFQLGRNVWLLMLASALGMTVAPIVVFIGGIVGANLAPDPRLSTLPVAALVIGTALAVLPVSRAMQRFGRKPVFIANTVFAAFAACLAANSIEVSSFWGFVASVVMLGASLAVVQQYRFAAMESVANAQMPKAASLVLLGGLLAAFVGPELAHLGATWFEQKFVGSFFLLAGACLLALPVLLVYRPSICEQSEQNSETQARPLKKLLQQPVLWVAVLSGSVGYAIMSYIMTATPVSMHVMQSFSLSDTKWVIQSHIAAMFLPSFFSGVLIARYGILKVMLSGVGVYVVCLCAAYAGQSLMHYWLGLVLLGVGWNFLFVSGTALLPQSYRQSERFSVQGFNDFVVFGLQALASLSSGYVIYRFGWEWLVVLAAPLLLVLLYSVWAWRRSQRATLV